MKQKKPTPKKTSGRNSRTPKPEFLTAFDTVFGRITGRVFKSTRDTITLMHPAQVEMVPTAQPDGRFGLRVRLQPLALVETYYHLNKGGIRGQSDITQPWFLDIYKAFEEASRAGKFISGPQIEVVSPEATQAPEADLPPERDDRQDEEVTQQREMEAGEPGFVATDDQNVMDQREAQPQVEA